MEKYQLNNGQSIPAIGMGTNVYWYRETLLSLCKGVAKDLATNNCREIRRHLDFYRIIRFAVANDCLMIDTARAYGICEAIVGRAVRDIPRDKLFLVTKLSNKHQRAGNIRGALEASLRQLNTDYIDLYLMHWPHPGTFANSWKQMEALYQEGIVKAIGVCNFHIHHLEELEATASIRPAVNQFECHPLLMQKPLVQYCKDREIQVMGYAPFALGNESLMQHPVLTDIARRYQKSVSQVILRWHLENKIIPIPATRSKGHFLANMDIFDFCLTEEDLNRIDGLDKGLRVYPDPDVVDYHTV